MKLNSHHPLEPMLRMGEWSYSYILVQCQTMVKEKREISLYTKMNDAF
jgi:hypothetical protein